MPEDGRLRPARLYVGALSAATVAALAGWAWLSGAPPLGWEAAAAAAVLTSACAAFRCFPVRFGRATLEVVEVPMLAALVLLGPYWALLVAVPSMLYRDRLRTLFTASTHLLTLSAAALAYGLFAGPLLFDGGGPGPGLAQGVLAAGLAYHALDDLIGMGLLRLKHGTPLGRSLREVMLPAVPADATAVMTVLACAWLFSAYGPLVPLAMFAGAALAVALLHAAREHREEVEALEARNAELEAELAGALASPLAFAHRLVEAVGEKDGHTARLAAASAVYARDAARELGLGREKVEKLRLAALLMDVGLASVPDEVLLTSPEKLNSVGKMHLERHPVRSERVLSSARGFEQAARWARWHHERADGSGYPDRLRGEWIPIEARVLAACETYASLVLGGPHSPGLSALEARRNLVGMASAGGLDSGAVRALLRVLDCEDAGYASASDERFAFGDEAPPVQAARRSGAAERARATP
jgi:HD-GYP domain-containing protein (c-di-GMP phosphodiesterase class II)